MAVYQFLDFIPVIHPTAFVHPQANVTGDVIIGPHCYIGPGAVLRGDWGRIVLEEGVNVQENCVVHMFVPQNTVLPARSIFVGNPGKVVKTVSDEMLAWKTEGTELYMKLAEQCHTTLKEVTPLEAAEPNRPNHEGTYQTHK